jgi:uncharacterized membrane protein YhaH (DUF805 family)
VADRAAIIDRGHKRRAGGRVALRPRGEAMILPTIDPLIAGGVVVTTAFTDAVYVQFNAAVSARRRFAAASWSSVWYLLAAFAVISYTSNWVYVLFAALGSWIGGFLSITALNRTQPLRKD